MALFSSPRKNWRWNFLCGEDFYSGTDYHFLVFGQNNLEEDDQKEVIRVVKYTKDWERVGAASLYAANTTKPF